MKVHVGAWRLMGMHGGSCGCMEAHVGICRGPRGEALKYMFAHGQTRWHLVGGRSPSIKSAKLLGNEAKLLGQEASLASELQHHAIMVHGEDRLVIGARPDHELNTIHTGPIDVAHVVDAYAWR